MSDGDDTLKNTLVDTLGAGSMSNLLGTEGFGFLQDAMRQDRSGPPITLLSTKVDPEGGVTHKAEISDDFMNRIQEAFDFEKAAIAAVKAQEILKQQEIERMTKGPLALVNVLGTLGQQMAMSPGMPGWLQGLGRGSAIVAPPVEVMRKEVLGMEGQVSTMSDRLADTATRLYNAKMSRDQAELNRKEREDYHAVQLRQRKEELAQKVLTNVKRDALKGAVITEREIRTRLAGMGFSEEEVKDFVATAQETAKQYRTHQENVEKARVDLDKAKADLLREQKGVVERRTAAYESIAKSQATFAADRTKRTDAALDTHENAIDKEIAAEQQRFLRAKQAEEDKLLALNNQLSQNLTADEATKGEMRKLITERTQVANQRLEQLRAVSERRITELQTMKQRAQGYRGSGSNQSSTGLQLEIEGSPVPSGVPEGTVGTMPDGKKYKAIGGKWQKQ